MDDIAPFHVMALLARAQALEAAGRDIVHMEIGEPDFDAPAPVVEAARRALDAGKTRYTPAIGIAPLRRAVARWYATRYGVDVSPERVVITPGASGALQLVMGVLVDRDERVLMADPGYPCNRHFVRAFEGEGVGIPVEAATGYQLTAEQVAERWYERTRAVMLASPANPTGTLATPGQIEAVAALARERGGRLIMDEIYHGLVYDGAEAPTALAYGDDVFVVNSFSKYFGMTGWRLGWIIAPQGYVEALERLAQNLFLAPSTLAQHAALAAFEPETLEILEHRRRELERRRDYLVPALRGIGFEIPVMPQGAFYLYAGCSRFAADAFELARTLLEEVGVAATPGIDFGRHRAGAHIRFAYTTSLARLREGVGRLRRLGDGTGGRRPAPADE